MRKRAVYHFVSAVGLPVVLAGCLSAALGEANEDEIVAPSNGIATVDASATANTTDPNGTSEDGETLPGTPAANKDAGPPACKLVGPPAVTEGDTLVWSDEFDGEKLDWKKWYVHDGYEGHGSILNTFSPSAISLHDGSLHVGIIDAPTDTSHPYVSGRIETFGRFSRTYGRIDFRAKFPAAPGIWYAVWARPSTTIMPEIDFEILGKNSKQAWFVNHWDVPPIPADDRRKYVTVETDTTEFHVYSILWKPDYMEWQLDGKPYMSSTTKGVPTSAIAWTINGWVGGWGAITTKPALPEEFEIDWIRVYRVDGLIADPELRVLNAKGEYTRAEVVDVEPANFDEACFVVEVYENAERIATLREWPYRFEMKKLGVGNHALSFVATDGVRSAKVELPITLK